MGRPTNAVKHKFQEILDGPSGIAKFKRIMAATTKDETYLAYFKECIDRAHGKPLQVNENFNHEDDRPTTAELDAAIGSVNGHSKGTGVEAQK